MDNHVHGCIHPGNRQGNWNAFKRYRQSSSFYIKYILEAFKLDIQKNVEFIAGFCYKKRREVL